ncbi:MAG: hypothetical protein PF485_05755 [Bacteroidales bacterium]|jgi:hypothetical protein|nr:hypothetical protein [Bacteroidales bacterium]
MNNKEIIDWLLQGDVSIQYQTYRDLLGEERKELKKRIETEGWGKQFLDKRNENGHWGRSFYQPKWTSTHYTLLDLRNLEISNSCKPIQQTIEIILKQNKIKDGGIHPIGTTYNSDVCINGMALNYCSYFKANEKYLESVVDFILSQQMKDGGFNCRLNRSGAKHSSLHTTISVLEGILEYKKNNYTYRLDELIKAEKESQEFILEHRLFKSDKTGEIIDKRFTKLSYPSRWRYDILRALDYFRFAEVEYDERMQDAIDIIIIKRNKDNIWNLQANHPGNVHFYMEKVGKPSRWNTLRALRVLNHFKVNN